MEKNITQMLDFAILLKQTFITSLIYSAINLLYYAKMTLTIGKMDNNRKLATHQI